MNEVSQVETHFYIIAGEVSGDRHASDLLTALKKYYPNANFKGIGGRYLRSAGQEQLFDMTVHAVVGLTDVLPKYFKFLSLFKKVLADIDYVRPDVLILVDYPGFNLRIAKKVREMFPETRIVYYISPQVWAWKSGRARMMAKYIDLVLLILPFEEEWYQNNAPKVKTKWIGHPIMDRWQVASTEVKAEEGKLRIALMPGSRRKEINTHLPVFLRAAKLLSAYKKGIDFVLLAADDRARELIESIVEEQDVGALSLEIHQGYQLTHLRRCSLALVASGTATLECCLARLPMFVVYRVSNVTYWLGKALVRLPYLSIVNILAKEKVVPEFLQSRVNEELLFEAARRVLGKSDWLEKTSEKLDEVANSLGKPGANKRAALALKRLSEQTS
ncbi:MAG: lipid-A-disaccharide synthase [Verrucomicrobiota bacterium]